MWATTVLRVQRFNIPLRNNGEQGGPENKMKLGLDLISHILAHRHQEFCPVFAPLFLDSRLLQRILLQPGKVWFLLKIKAPRNKIKYGVCNKGMIQPQPADSTASHLLHTHTLMPSILVGVQAHGVQILGSHTIPLWPAWQCLILSLKRKHLETKSCIKFENFRVES